MSITDAPGDKRIFLRKASGLIRTASGLDTFIYNLGVVSIGLGVGWSTLVAAELVAATQGLGFMVQSAAQFLVTDVVVLGILVIALVAFALELGLRTLQRKLVPWHGQNH